MLAVRKHTWNHLEVGHPNNPKNYPICGANKPNGTPCLQKAGWKTEHPSVGRCTRHGGSSLAGPAHPSFVNGKYASAYHGRLKHQAQQVRAASDGKDILDLTDEIEVSKTMLYSSLDAMSKLTTHVESILSNVDSDGGGERDTAIGGGSDSVGPPDAPNFQANSDLNSRLEELEGLLSGEALENLERLMKHQKVIVEMVEGVVRLSGNVMAARLKRAYTAAEMAVFQMQAREALDEFIPEKGRQVKFLNRMFKGFETGDN